MLNLFKESVRTISLWNNLEDSHSSEEIWVSPELVLSCHPTFSYLPFSSLLQCGPVCSHPGVSAPLKSQHFQTQFFLAAKTAQWTELAVMGEAPLSVLFPTGPAATCDCGKLHWLTAEGLPSMHKAVGLIPALHKLGVVTYSCNLSTNDIKMMRLRSFCLRVGVGGAPCIVCTKSTL